MDDFDLDYIDEICNEWIDEWDEWTSLRTLSLNDENTRINQQIVNNIYNIRRHFEFDLNYTDEENETEINFNENSNIFINNLFTILNETISDSINQEFEDVKVTLTPDQFSRLKNITITACTDDYLNKQCNICMDNYNLKENITFTVCDHFFHTDCIKNWLCNEKVTCPVCRKDNRLLN